MPLKLFNCNPELSAICPEIVTNDKAFILSVCPVTGTSFMASVITFPVPRVGQS